MDFAAIAGNLGLDWKLFLFHLINTLIVLVVLKQYAFGPIMNAIQERQRFAEEVRISQLELATAKKDMQDKIIKSQEEAKAQYNQTLELALQDAKTRSELVETQVLEQATKDGLQLIENAKREIATYKKQAHQEIVESIVSTTKKLVKSSVQEEKIAKNASQLIQ